MIIVWFIIWLLVGAASFAYWWTKESDLTSEEIPLMLVVSIAGPFAFLIGYLVHGNHGNHETTVFIKRRK